jgi:hypothetical protein
MADALSHLKFYQKLLLAVIIGFSVVSFWRGVWGLLDTFLFPGEATKVLSYSLSVIIGVAILSVTGYITKIMD